MNNSAPYASQPVDHLLAGIYHQQQPLSNAHGQYEAVPPQQRNFDPHHQVHVGDEPVVSVTGEVFDEITQMEQNAMMGVVSMAAGGITNWHWMPNHSIVRQLEPPSGFAVAMLPSCPIIHDMLNRDKMFHGTLAVALPSEAREILNARQAENPRFMSNLAMAMENDIPSSILPRGRGSFAGIFTRVTRTASGPRKELWLVVHGGDQEASRRFHWEVSKGGTSRLGVGSLFGESKHVMEKAREASRHARVNALEKLARCCLGSSAPFESLNLTEKALMTMIEQRDPYVAYERGLLNTHQRWVRPSRDAPVDYPQTFCGPYTLATDTVTNTFDNSNGHAAAAAAAAETSKRVYYYAGCTPVGSRVNGGVVVCESPGMGISVLLGAPSKKFAFGSRFRPSTPTHLGAFPCNTGRIASLRSVSGKLAAIATQPSSHKSKAMTPEPLEPISNAYLFWEGKGTASYAAHPRLTHAIHRTRNRHFQRCEHAMGHDPTWGTIELAPMCVRLAPPQEEDTGIVDLFSDE